MAGQVEVRVARIFNTFGPRMHPNDGRVVSNFIIQVQCQTQWDIISLIRGSLRYHPIIVPPWL